MTRPIRRDGGCDASAHALPGGGLGGIFQFRIRVYIWHRRSQDSRKGFVNVELVTPQVILAGLLGGIVWDLITWWFGLPTSSSHALIGGYAGAALANAGYDSGRPELWKAWSSASGPPLSPLS